MRNKVNFYLSLVFILLFAIAVFLHSDFSITIDEPLHRYYGNSIINYYFSLGQDTSFHKLFNLKYYGPFFDLNSNLLYRIIPSLGAYDSMHLLCAIFSIIGLFYLFKISQIWFRNTFYSLIVVFVVFFSPLYFNSSFNQPKDIPFSSLFIISSYFLLRLYLVTIVRAPVKLLIFLAISIGLTNAVRSLGILVYLLLFAIVTENLIINWKNESTRKIILKKSFILGLSSFAILVLFFPFLHKSPVKNYIETILIFSKFPHSMDYLFWGKIINSLDTPRIYLISFLLIKTPEYILLGLLFTLIPFLKINKSLIGKKELKLYKAILFSFLFIIILLFILKPVLYEPRQILFLFPFLYMISIFCFKIISNIGSSAKITILSIIVSGLLYSIYLLYIYHPSQSSYYNTIISKPLNKSDLFDIPIQNTKSRIEALISDHLSKNKIDNPRITYLYNSEEDEWNLGLKMIGADKSLIDEFKKIFPFPINLRQEYFTYYFPEFIQTTSDIYKADYILGEDLINHKNLEIDYSIHDYRGELDFIDLHKVKK